MAARTSAALALAIAAGLGARELAADVTDHEILGDDDSWRVEDVQLRTTYLDQDGRGFQSQDGGTPGDETLRVIQPAAHLTVRQSARVVHQVTLPIDVITAASPDAVDATTSASKNNTAGDLDLRSQIAITDRDTLRLRFTAHAEEWIGGGIVGAGWKRSLADDNATVSINGTFGYDVFDDHNHFGNFLGKTGRTTTNLSIAGSQLLSPTTVVDASYGVTLQRGTLRTGWNAVPVMGGLLTDEVLPERRLRHAVTAGIAQHVPATHSTVKARYRFYRDDFGVRAHTIDAALYQYVVPWLYVRGGYRFHDQTAVDFFTTELAPGFDAETLRTADSDLAGLHAHEVSLSLATVRGRGPLGTWSVSAEALRYDRSNGLRILAITLGLGKLL